MNNLTIICGMPRSGTTWLGKIFDSHPRTYYLHEPDSLAPMKDIPRVILPQNAHEYQARFEEYLPQLISSNGSKVRGKRPVFKKSYLTLPGLLCHRTSILVASVLARRGYKLPVITPIHKERIEGIHYVWKSVEAAGRLPVIAMFFPEIRVIYEVRHPCGYVASIIRGIQQGRFNTSYSPGQDYAIFRLLLASPFAKQRGVTEEFLRSVSDLERLAWRWCLTNDFVLSHLEHLDNCKIVRYEDLCVSPETTARELLGFSGIEWSSQVENFIGISSGGGQDQYYGVFRESKASADKWSKELTREEIAIVESVVAGSRGGILYGLS